jgi:hypothetical protein
MPPEHARGAGLLDHNARIVHLGRFRGAATPEGGFYLEIVGNGEVRRAEMTPRETVMVAIAMLRSQGVEIVLDINRFRHR